MDKNIRNRCAHAVLEMIEKINYFFVRLNRSIANNEIIKVVHIHTYQNASIHYIYLFGKKIYPFKSKGSTGNWYDPAQPVMYLKINRKADYTLNCIQHWVNIAYHLKSDFYFICDNKQLEYNVLNHVTFPDLNVKILKSERKALRTIAETVSTGKWINVANAQLTTFYHAKKNGIKRFWAIDADDTSFCMSDSFCANALRSVSEYTNQKEISIISLDMWHSRTNGRHWSWGVAYINDNVNLLDICHSNHDLSWIESGEYPFRLGSGETNTDWFFTYLKFIKKIKIETFYLENTWFIHWGNFMKFPGMVAAVYHWKNHKLSYPVYRFVHLNDRFGYIDIAADSIKFDIKISDEERMHFFSNELKEFMS